MQPYDEKGRKVTRQCPDPDCGGTLQASGDGEWACDGLVDPNHSDMELTACTFTHRDGEPYNATPEQYAAWAQNTGRMVGQPAPIYANGHLVHQSTD